MEERGKSETDDISFLRTVSYITSCLYLVTYTWDLKLPNQNFAKFHGLLIVAAPFSWSFGDPI